VLVTSTPTDNGTNIRIWNGDHLDGGFMVKIDEASIFYLFLMAYLNSTLQCLGFEKELFLTMTIFCNELSTKRTTLSMPLFHNCDIQKANQIEELLKQINPRATDQNVLQFLGAINNNHQFLVGLAKLRGVAFTV
jgi:hypothetical protein